ncbi:purine catabolism regulator-like protein [Corynebacterium mustelae]|uniref:Purine catabolism regulator-like protein n=1 Tax=Corynebacterium mustelae TaxID=571915 RepID=A0A0G3H4F1_9CORY|nr:purine catabolism regulator-like protein [Corynebacterium mustelae]
MVQSAVTESETISLEWLMNQKKLKLKKLTRTDVRFTVVQPTELENPSEFLSPGALVLLVGLAFESAPAKFADYVRNLSQAGVAAIGFGTGLSFDTVPPALVDAAREANLALFEVPRDVPFVSILTTVRKEFARRESQQQAVQLKLQSKLHAAAISGGIPSLLRTLANEISAAVALCNIDGTVVESVSFSGMDATEITAKQPPHDLALSRAFSTAGKYHLIQKLSTQGASRYVLVTTAPQPYSKLANRIVSYAASLADILLHLPVDVRQGRNELNTLALEMLLAEKHETTHGKSALARIFSPLSDGNDDVRPVVIHSDSATTTARAIASCDAHLALRGYSQCTMPLAGGFQLFLLTAALPQAEIVEMFAEHKPKLKIAIGAVLSWRSVTTATVDALCSTALALPPGGTATADSTSLSWLHEPSVQQALRNRAAETIGRLADYDKKTNSDLVATLSAYLRSGNHVADASHLLGIHRHTMRTRLQKIETVCELSLNNPVTCAELLLVVITQAV